MKIVDVRDSLGWNPRRNRWATRPLDAIQKIILHQELGEASTASVNSYHQRYDERGDAYGRNWPRIAYHYTIEFNGNIFVCNDLTDVTWHCKGSNTNGIGIMLQGNFDGPNHRGISIPTKDQEESFYQLIDSLLNELNLLPTDVYGHCDFGKPACPGFAPYKWVKRVRGEI